jgi:hypothetical protein
MDCNHNMFRELLKGTQKLWVILNCVVDALNLTAAAAHTWTTLSCRNKVELLPFEPPNDGPESPFLVASDGNETVLGIPVAILKSLYLAVHASFLAARKGTPGPELELATRAVLLLNPELYTGWNDRKRLIEGGILTVDEELDFIQMVLGTHAKAREPWSQR